MSAKHEWIFLLISTNSESTSFIALTDDSVCHFEELPGRDSYDQVLDYQSRLYVCIFTKMILGGWGGIGFIKIVSNNSLKKDTSTLSYLELFFSKVSLSLSTIFKSVCHCINIMTVEHVK